MKLKLDATEDVVISFGRTRRASIFGIDREPLRASHLYKGTIKSQEPQLRHG